MKKYIYNLQSMSPFSRKNVKVPLVSCALFSISVVPFGFPLPVQVFCLFFRIHLFLYSFLLRIVWCAGLHIFGFALHGWNCMAKSRTTGLEFGENLIEFPGSPSSCCSVTPWPSFGEWLIVHSSNASLHLHPEIPRGGRGWSG